MLTNTELPGSLDCAWDVAEANGEWHVRQRGSHEMRHREITTKESQECMALPKDGKEP
jgi:hypothetical protein